MRFLRREAGLLGAGGDIISTEADIGGRGIADLHCGNGEQATSQLHTAPHTVQRAEAEFYEENFKTIC